MPVPRTTLYALLTFLFCASLAPTAAHAQLGAVTGSNSTPVPGAGHDYIHLLNETVDPSSGNLSLRIQVPMPPARGITVPFSFNYDSNATQAYANIIFLPQGGGTNIPSINCTPYMGGFQCIEDPPNVGTPPPPGDFSVSPEFNLAATWSSNTPHIVSSSAEFPMYNYAASQFYYCHVYTGFVFYDSSGAAHQLPVAFAWPDFSEGTDACSWDVEQNSDFGGIQYPNENLSGGDGQYQAWFAYPGCTNNTTGGCSLAFATSGDVALNVAGPDGTVYSFFSLGYGVQYPSIEDRNGNVAAVGGGGQAPSNHTGAITDTMGRLALSVSTSSTSTSDTVSGLGGSYTVTYGTATASWTPGSTLVYGTSSSCPTFPGVGGLIQVITAITLPNGQQYTFSYDPTYGLLDKITYPTGGYVQYVWGVNPRSAALSYGGNCMFTYDKPAVVQRNVSFDGSTIALEQTFSYATNWNDNGLNTVWSQKTTTVTTNDQVSGTSYQTKYTYGSITNPPTPDTPTPTSDIYLGGDLQIPVEQTVQYQGTNGGVLRTTTKNWFDQFHLACELDTLDSGQIRGEFYSYGFGGVVTDVKEYDYGNSPPVAVCQNSLTAPSSPHPSRETLTTYQSFAPTPTYPAYPSILDRPCSVLVYGNGGQTNGPKVAETDYLYDGGASVCGTAGTPSVASANSPVQHNSAYAYNASSQPPRGNVTSVIRQCFQGSTACPQTQGNPTTTYTYDETGQVTSMTDPCGNASCSDMAGTNHTTTYSYLDNYSNGCSGAAPPSGNTNAYLTKITDPLGHIQTFCYGYTDGQLRGSIDENNQNTTYIYNDLLDRLTNITYPPTVGAETGGGTETISYQDSSPVSVTDTRSISGQISHVNTTLYDNMGHATQTQTAVPTATCSNGTVYVDTGYYGTGQVRNVSNPHCTSSSPTDGTTTSVYDALGRTLSVTHPDGSMIATQYSGNSTTATDEAGNPRESFTDGLGRLVEIEEPSPSAAPPTPGTGSATTSGTEHSTYVPPSGGYGSVQIYGSEQCTYDQVCDYGYVTVLNVSCNYDQYDNTDAPSMASCLAGQLNSSGFTASLNGTTINITAKTTGPGSNYPISASAQSNSGTFGQPSFTVYGSGLSGGANGSTVYDTGTVWVTVNGHKTSASYGQGDTSASVASNLANAINADSAAYVQATASGATLSLTSRTAGASTDFSLSEGSSTSMPSLFSSPSFSVSVSGSALTGGSGGTIGSGALITMYTYDALDNLLQVQQQGNTSVTTQWRTRTFAYNSLSQLVSSINPESNTVPCGTPPCSTVATTYSYDANGNLSYKTMPAQNQQSTATVTLSYCYDVLDRLTAKVYTQQTCNPSQFTSPVATYAYDGVAPLGCSPTLSPITNPVGRRTGMCDAAGSEAWSYDPMGRAVADKRTTNGVSMITTYVYNDDSSLKTLTYPSGRIITYAPTPMGQPASALDIADSINYAQTAQYNPAGALSSLVLGPAGAFTGININSAYNSRLQPTSIVAYSTAGTALSLSYCFYPLASGVCPSNPRGRDNGNVVQISNTLNSSRSQTFTYDSLNRVATASSGTWGESYSLDAWGNLNQFVPYNGLPLVDKSASQLADGSNRIIGFCYDTAGNLLDQGACASSHAYTYNAENQLTFTAQVNYIYDGDGNRVEKYMPSANPPFYELYWYGGGSDPLEETDGTGNLTNTAFHEYVFFGGKRIARRDGTTSGDVQYYIADHLGSARVVTNATGVTQTDIDYCPYGAQCYVASDTSGNNYKFTGKERDTESGLDNFEARYDTSSLGRFMSPDPLGGHQLDPQTLNKYVYVRNNPLSLTDPTGLDFSLPCAQNNGTTCQGGTVHYKDANGDYQETLVHSNADGSLTDQSENKYTATVTGAGVSFTGGGVTNAVGTFVNGTNATTIQGTGGLSGFTFNFTYSNWAGDVTAGGTFTYGGTFQQAESALENAGFHHYKSDNHDPFHPSTLSYHATDFRSAGDVGTGANSGHFTVDEPWMFMPYDALRSPTNGDVHLGEHNDNSPGGFWPHTGEVIRTLLQRAFPGPIL
jgi:RHS repeat-associated protein